MMETNVLILILAVPLFGLAVAVVIIYRRVSRLEDGQEQTRGLLREIKDDMQYSAERRSTVLHDRINVLVENVSAMKGTQEGMGQAFNNFTKVMLGMTRAILKANKLSPGAIADPEAATEAD